MNKKVKSGLIALVIAIIVALAIAVTGGSSTARDFINGKDIRNHSITQKKLDPDTAGKIDRGVIGYKQNTDEIRALHERIERLERDMVCLKTPAKC